MKMLSVLGALLLGIVSGPLMWFGHAPLWAWGLFALMVGQGLIADFRYNERRSDK